MRSYHLTPALREGEGAEPEGEGFEQRLFRAVNGQVYQVLQFDSGASENGAEAIQVTTLVGSLGGSVPGCFNTAGDSIPTAVTGVQPGRAFDPNAVFKSPILSHSGQPCFNRNGAGGSGALCVGAGCTSDCLCNSGADCSSFSLGEDGTERTAITAAAGGVPQARVATLAEPFPPCDGFAGRSAYAFGTSGPPSTEQVLCGTAPSDGFTLPSGSTVVFAYATRALELFNAGAAGLLIDQNGASAASCGTTPAVLSPGAIVGGTAFAPRAEFRSGNLVFRYDDDPQDTNRAPDATLEGCQPDVLIECAATPTPTATPGAERPCGAIVLDSIPATPIAASIIDREDSAKVPGCGWPTGNRDVVYELTATAAGIYDVRVRGASFAPILYVREESCEGTQLPFGCTGAASGGVRDREIALDLDAGKTVAIVVDGASRANDTFTLEINQRRPDLLVTEVNVAPTTANAGDAVRVMAQIRNDGDQDAGEFVVEFVLARDERAIEVVSAAPLRVRLNGLAAASAGNAAPPNDFTLPLVASGEYFLVARMDADGQVAERSEENNLAAQLIHIGRPPGVILEQHIFRAGDGTVYQLLQAAPQLSPTAEASFRVTSLAASLRTVTVCEQNGVNSGDPLEAAVGSAQIADPTTIKRTEKLQPNNFATPLFEELGGGRLVLGVGGGVIEICSRSETCDGIPLVPTTEASVEFPAACVATLTSGSYCADEDTPTTIGFGLAGADGICSNPVEIIAASRKCNGVSTLANGVTLEGGEAVVLVHEAGPEAIEVGLAAFGVTAADSDECGAEQVVSAKAEREFLAHLPILSFVQGLQNSHPVAIALSDDGRNVYVVGESLWVLGRSQETGELESVIQQVTNRVAGVRGLAGANSVTLSPDGAHVYVASSLDNAVVVFRRDSTDGELSFVEAETDGVDGVDGLAGANSVTVSTDGRHVYVVGSLDNAVTVFRRDATSGGLSVVESKKEGVDGVGGLDRPRSVAVSPDGVSVYVASLISNGVAVFRRDGASGELSFVEVARGHDFLDLFGPSSVTVSPDGRHVYVATLFVGAAVVFRRDETSGALTFVEVERTHPGGLDGGLFDSSSVTVSPDGEYVYVAGESVVAVFRRDGTSGELSLVEVERNIVDRLTGVDSLTVSPDGRYVYIASVGNDAVMVLRREETSGELSFLKAERDSFDGMGGLTAFSSVSVSPDGGHVYATSFRDDAVAVFRRDGRSGQLTFAGAERDGVGSVDGLAGADSVTVSPDGRHVYVASSSALATFRRITTSGELSFVEVERNGVDGVDGLFGASSVVVSPDGDYLYVAGSSTLVVFRRSVTSGELSFLEAKRNGVGDVDGLLDAESVAVSPQGDHVYVASLLDSAVAVFQRDGTSGELSFVEALKCEFDHDQQRCVGVDGLFQARSVTVSPGGKHVYVAGSSAVAIFRRDGTSGKLSFVAVEREGVGGADGRRNANSVTVSPDGSQVFVASGHISFNDGAVAVFQRDGTSGELILVEAAECAYDTRQQGCTGLDGFGGADSIAMTADGRHLYVITAGKIRMAVFRVR